MFRFIFFAILISCFSSNAQNLENLAGQKFAVKRRFIDSFAKSISGLSTSDANLKIRTLETWAEEHADPELASELTLLRYRQNFENNPTADVIEENKLQEMLVSAQQAKMKYLEADILQKLGDYYWNKARKNEAAFENYLAAYRIYAPLSCEEFPPKQGYFYTLGSAYFSYGDVENAIKYLREAAAASQYNGTDLHNPIANSLGLCFRKRSQFDSSEWYFMKAYNHAVKKGDTMSLGIACGNIGINYYLQNRYEEAKPLLLTDISIGIRKNVVNNAANSMCILASIYYQAGNVDSCENLLLQALSLCREKPFWPDYSISEPIYRLLAKVYQRHGNANLAYLYADSALISKDSVVSRYSALSLAKAQQKAEFDERKLQQEKLEISQLALSKKRNEGIFMICGIVLMLLVIAFIIRSYRLLSAEKHKSEELLLNILPAEVAHELKENGSAKAQHYDQVTVLFTDFINFTEAGERMTPQRLVNELHTCFSAFDEIVGKHNTEKIKTVGDAYMAVSGLPTPNPKQAEDVVAAAIEILAFMRERQSKLGNLTFGIRMGIHTGPAVAGIVGVKKFSYDIWGDTVNTAARMEQSSIGGRINISDATYKLVKDKFPCEYRGKIEVKNKGSIDMYFVLT